MQLQQFASGNPLYVSEAAHHLAVEQSLSVSTDK
jgi:hypothetical protein